MLSMAARCRACGAARSARRRQAGNGISRACLLVLTEADAANRRATDGEVLEDAERLIAAWNERPGAASNRLVGVVSGAVPMLCKEELIFAVTIVNASTARLPLFVRLRLRFARCVVFHDGRPWWVFC